MGIIWFLSLLVVNLSSFKLIATLPEGDWARHYAYDTDHNGLDEFIFEYPPHFYWVAWEYRPGDQYEKVYDWSHPEIPDTSITLIDIGDSDKDGLSEFLVALCIRIRDNPYRYIHETAIIESKNFHSYPSSIVWFDSGGTSPVKFIDFDNDGKMDIFSRIYNSFQSGFKVYENEGDNKFSQTFEISVPRNKWWDWDHMNRNCVFGDFDGDGRMEWFVATTDVPPRHPSAWIWECTGDNDYKETWEDTIHFLNTAEAWLGNDTDRDGKPEIFVRGYGTYPTEKVMLARYEAVGNDTYEFKVIDTIEGGGMAGRSTCGDVLGDGKEEVVVSVGTKVIIYRSWGNDKYYKIWEWKNNLGRHNDMAAVLCHDFNKNGRDEIVISNPDATHIYEFRPPGITSKPETILSFNLSISPNPANGMVDIRYEIPDKNPVSLKVYNVTGRLVKTLIKIQNQKPGVYTTIWDGRDERGKEIPSGIYFLRLEAKGFAKTRRVVLIR